MNNVFRYVSIIIPTYNRSSSLGMTLDSCINQTYPKDKYEIIVADNNSSDNTRSMVEEWKLKSDVSIKYILEERQGTHFSRNTAAKHSNSEICIIRMMIW